MVMYLCTYIFIVRIGESTFKKGIGNPMSTLRYCTLFCDAIMSVSSFNFFLILFSPSLVSRSHISSKSFFSISPDTCSTIIWTCSAFRILQIVAVDSLFLPTKIFFPKILLIKVDLPELVSPEKIKTSVIKTHWIKTWFSFRMLCTHCVREWILFRIIIEYLKKNLTGKLENEHGNVLLTWSRLNSHWMKKSFQHCWNFPETYEYV